MSVQEQATPKIDEERYGVHLLNETYMRLYQKGLETAQMPEHPWRTPRFFHLIQMLTLTNGLEGATVEAGCFRGLASYLICEHRKLEQSDFDGAGHFMIDSFEGLSEPVDEDGDFSKQRHSEGAFKQTSLEHCQNTMKGFPKTTIIRGWIPKAFDELPDQKYRFVHIDVDIYEPTLDSLRYFYPRLVTGGIIVVDDYGPWPGNKWPGCKIAVEEFSNEFNVPMVGLDTGNAVCIKRS